MTIIQLTDNMSTTGNTYVPAGTLVNNFICNEFFFIRRMKSFTDFASPFFESEIILISLFYSNQLALSAANCGHFYVQAYAHTFAVIQELLPSCTNFVQNSNKINK